MTDRYYDTTAGEFIDFETLDDWKSRDAAKDARIEALETKLERAEEQEVKAHRQGYEQARAACTEFTRALVERIKSLEAEQNRLSQQCEGLAQAASNNGQALIISEAKLAKAIGTLELIQTIDVHEPCGEDLGTCGRLARDTLAELKEETHDRPTTEK
jgi:molybdenum-dependent DNA-binding transcriptional regulator ModE